jgi:hypothetical protein
MIENWLEYLRIAASEVRDGKSNAKLLKRAEELLRFFAGSIPTERESSDSEPH